MPEPGATGGVRLTLHPARRSVLVRSVGTIVRAGVLAVVGWVGGHYARVHLVDSAWWQWGPLLAASAWVLGRVGYEVLLRRSRRYVLDEAKITASSGVFHTTHTEAALHRVQQVVLDRTLLERLTGLGTIVVTTAGSQTVDVAWVMVKRPRTYLDAVRAGAARAAASAAATSRRGAIPVLGLAGGVGAGKSAVAAVLRDMGYHVVDSDKEAKEALDRPEVLGQLVRWWGARVVGEDGKVKRGVVAEIVFNDAAERARLEALVHPIVKADRATLIARAAAEGKRGVAIDAPLLFEAGSDAECDGVLFVDAPKAVRVARVRETRGWDERELNRRENAQMPLEEKRRRSDIVIVNDADPETLRERVRRGVEAWESRGGAGWSLSKA